MSYQYQHGLVVMRAQPLHIGHERVLRDMLENAPGLRSFWVLFKNKEPPETPLPILPASK